MMIHSDKCKELGLPEPKNYDTQETYILRVIAQGHKLNTRLCRYIGIHNLHSIASALQKKCFDFVLCHGRTLCPFTGLTPPFAVDIVYMTEEQIISFKNKKKPE